MRIGSILSFNIRFIHVALFFDVFALTMPSHITRINYFNLYFAVSAFTEDGCEGEIMRAWCATSRNEWLVIDDFFFGRADETTCQHNEALTNDTECIGDQAAMLADIRQVGASQSLKRFRACPPKKAMCVS